MMGYPLTCIACQRPFPANPTLASLPYAGRLGIDPVRQRAWRICLACGEWNLLGREESAVVISEADALLRAAPVREVDSGIHEVALPGLSVLRVELEPGEAMDAAVAGRQDAVQVRQSRMAKIGAVAAALILGVFVLGVLFPSVLEWVGGWSILTMMLPIWAAQTFATAYRRWRLNGDGVKGLMVVGAVLTLIGTAVQWTVSRSGALLVLGATLLFVALFALVDRGMPFGWTKLPSGGRQVLRRWEMDLTRLWLDASDRLRITLPNGKQLAPDDGDAVLRDLLDGYSWETNRQAQSAGLQLARGADPLPRILELLRPALMAEPAGLPLVKLPEAWRAALDLAMAASGGEPSRLSELAEKAREAQEVAGIAESLDRVPDSLASRPTPAAPPRPARPM